MSGLTDAERETLLCDCKRYADDDSHHEICSSGMEYDTLLDPAALIERVEALIAAHLAAERESIASGIEAAGRAHSANGNRCCAASLAPLPGLIRREQA